MDFPTKNSDRTNKNHGFTLQWWVFSYQMWRIANNFIGNWTNKIGNVTDWWFNKHFEGGRATLTRAHYNNYKKILELWGPMHKQLRAFNCMQELGGMRNYRIRPLDMVRQKETCPTIVFVDLNPHKNDTKRGPICRIASTTLPHFPWKQGKMMGHSVRPHAKRRRTVHLRLSALQLPARRACGWSFIMFAIDWPILSWGIRQWVPMDPLDGFCLCWIIHFVVVKDLEPYQL